MFTTILAYLFSIWMVLLGSFEIADDLDIGRNVTPMIFILIGIACFIYLLVQSFSGMCQ